MTAPDQYVSVRYLVDDVHAAIDFYTTHLGFRLNTSAAPAFADVVRGHAAAAAVRTRQLRRPRHPRTTPPPPAATASNSSSTTWMPRSTGSAARACRSAATWSPAPAGARSCSPTPTAT